MPSAQEMLQQAGLLFQQGQLAQAEALYKNILQAESTNFGALHMLGLIALQRRNLNEAIALIGQAISVNPTHPSAHFNMGGAYARLQQYESALASFERAAALKPDYAEAHNNRGNALCELKRYEDALASYDRALTLRPDYVDAHNNRGGVLCDLKRYEPALASYDRALALRPDYAEAWSNRGNALCELKRYEEALASFERALTLMPNYAKAHNNRSNALRGLKRHEEALASCDRALALRPDYVQAYSNRAIALCELKRYEEALASCDRALALKPDYAEAYYNRGIALSGLLRYEEAIASCDSALALKPGYAEAWGNRSHALCEMSRHEEALASCDRALALKPDYVEAHINRGCACAELHRHEEALASYGHALALKPDHAEVHCNEGLCRLRLGDFETGWKKYEWRWQRESYAALKRNFAQPLWLGMEPLAGKTILLHAEQGLGDTIQLARYAAAVASRGATVLLEVQAPLKRLLASAPGVTGIFAKGETPPAFDYHCPFMSLPLACRTSVDNIPAQEQYLRSDPARVDQWRARLGQQTRPYVGLVWSGNALHKNDRNRSMPLAEMAKLLSNQAQFFSLQKEVRPADLPVLERHPELRHVGGELGDFTDTAAVMSLMDIVITVDTSIAHLAGALGKPVWILLPFSPDWRWMLERSDSPWYPSARLFRQENAGDWQGVIQQAAGELSRFLSG